MRNRKIAIFIVSGLLVAGLTAAGWWYTTSNPQTAGRISTVVAPAQSSGPAVVSGFVEADEVAVSTEIGGRITALSVEEGQLVNSGQTLVKLDRSVVDAELAVAQAKVDAARAALAFVRAGPRPEVVAQAQAAVGLAEAYRDQAYQASLDAKMLVNQQPALDAQITQVQAQVTVAQEKLKAATANKDALEIAKDKAQDDLEFLQKQWAGRIRVPGNPVLNQWWLGWVGLNAADANYQGTVALLNDLKAQRNSPVAQIAQMHSAQTVYQASLAQVAQAEARLNDLRAGATAEQIGAAEAQVRVAEAQVSATEAKIKKLTIAAPINGVVLERTVYTDELAAPSATLITLADLDKVSLVVYVPEAKLSAVQVGQKVSAQVDSFPGQSFAGVIVNIADKADYIPDRVQSPEDRVSLVFAVKISLPNPGHLLKPGMPADMPLEQP
jgi:HlyD family secretion protein